MALGYDTHPNYQRGIRFDQAPGVFVWVKHADGGRARTDTGPMVAAALAAGKRVGAYTYAQPGDGAAHADVLLAAAASTGAVTLFPAIDIEDDRNIHIWSTAEATEYGRAFCARVRARGLRPVVYMNASKMQACRPDLWPENPVIWCARYGAKPEAIDRSTGKPMYAGRYDVHQFTSSLTVAGSAGLVDGNESYTNAHYVDQVLVDSGAVPVVDNRTLNLDDEDNMIILPAGKDVHESVFVKGKSALYFCTADLGDSPVLITSIDFYGDTPKGTSAAAGVGGQIRGAQIDPHRPGPLPVPVGATTAQIRYTADHSFTVATA